MKETRIIFELALIVVIVLCSFLVTQIRADANLVCRVFWGCLVIVSIFVICLTICICKEVDSNVEATEKKISELTSVMSKIMDAKQLVDKTTVTKQISAEKEVTTTTEKSNPSALLNHYMDCLVEI